MCVAAPNGPTNAAAAPPIVKFSPASVARFLIKIAFTLANDTATFVPNSAVTSAVRSRLSAAPAASVRVSCQSLSLWPAPTPSAMAAEYSSFEASTTFDRSNVSLNNQSSDARRFRASVSGMGKSRKAWG